MLLHILLRISRCWNLTWCFDIIWEAPGVQVFQEVSWHSFPQDHVQSHLPLRPLTLPRCCQMSRANMCSVRSRGHFRHTVQVEPIPHMQRNWILPTFDFCQTHGVFFDFAVQHKWKCVDPLTFFHALKPQTQVCSCHSHSGKCDVCMCCICAQMSYHIISSSPFQVKNTSLASMIYLVLWGTITSKSSRGFQAQF